MTVTTMIEKITDGNCADADANADATRRKCRCQPTLETEAFHTCWLTDTLSNGAVTPGAAPLPPID